jgi:hypothetical protein
MPDRRERQPVFHWVLVAVAGIATAATAADFRSTAEAPPAR